MISFERDNQLKNSCGGLPIAFKVGDFGIARDMNAENIKKMKFN